MDKTYYKKIQSPVGKLTLVSSETHLLAVLWENDPPGRVQLEKFALAGRHPILLEGERQLREYFAGKRRIFDLPLEFRGTEFQKKVWKALTRISFGKTASYSELALAIRAPQASRAVGAANGKNPLSIVVPCHRVIGKNGTLTGFAGGLNAKRFLLKFEGAYP